MKYRRIVCFSCILAIALVVGCRPSAETTTELQTGKGSEILPLEYVSTTYPFSFKTPDGWRYQENYQDTSAVMAVGQPDKQGQKPNINVVVMSVTPDLLDTTKEQYEEEVKKLGVKCELALFEKASFAGHDALHLVTNTQLDEEMLLTQEQYLFNAGQYGYSVTCSATSDTFQEIEETFKKILASFEFR